MNAASLINLRKRLGMSRRKMAEQLGVGRDTLARYEAGSPIPATVALACAALAFGLPPME